MVDADFIHCSAKRLSDLYIFMGKSFHYSLLKFFLHCLVLVQTKKDRKSSQFDWKIVDWDVKQTNKQFTEVQKIGGKFTRSLLKLRKWVEIQQQFRG